MQKRVQDFWEKPRAPHIVGVGISGLFIYLVFFTKLPEDIIYLGIKIAEVI